MQRHPGSPEKVRPEALKKAIHLFAGLTYCGVCGGDQKMYVPSGSKKYICQKCRNKIPVQDLEAVFHEQLKSFFWSEEEVGKYLEGAHQGLKEKQELLTGLEKERAKLKSQMDKLMQLYLADQLTPEAFGRENKPLEERFQQLGERIPEFQGEIDFIRIKFQSSGEIISEAKDLYSRWPSLNREEKRTVIEQITERIVVGKGDISIDLCYLPSSLKEAAEGQRNVMAMEPAAAVESAGCALDSPAKL